MSLATRCPACGTIFRVVQDQLKVSEGWVRCGRCAEVFNASDALIDLQPTGAPGTEPGALPTGLRARADTPARTAAAAGIDSRPGVLEGPDESGFDEADRSAAATDRSGPAFAASGPSGTDLPGMGLLRAPSVEARSEDSERSADGDAADARSPALTDESTPGLDGARSTQRSDPLADPPGQAAAAAAVVEPGAVPAPAASAAPALPATQGLPHAVWPWAAAALAALLLAQAGVAWRDTVAAAVPALRPALEALCGLSGCSVQAPRRLDTLSVQSSGLTQLEGTPHYRLDVVVRNRATVAVLPPAVDLTLTDAQGRIVSRRVLLPAELGLSAPALGASGEVGLRAVLATGGVPVAGYTVELFYP